jgi:hypothetical protein
MIDGQKAYDTKEEAIKVAEEKGCGGYHEHEVEGVVYYMPCETHTELKAPCWDGYEQIGTKIKDGKEVPNCVPLSEMKLTEENELQELTDQLSEYGQDEADLLEDYELIDVSEVDYENDDLQDELIKELNEEKPKQSTLSKIVNLVRTGQAFPDRKSAQDGVTKQTGLQKFMVRYQYAPLKVDNDGRKFCKAMVRAKRIYRKEDIIKMGKQPVNPGFGVKGASTYSIWLYKGGARCQHKWFRKTYMLTLDGDKSLVTTTKAKSLGFKFPVNDQLVPVAPKDMKYKGYTKAYWDKMGFGKKKKKK